jgi:hypothetical protein
VVTEKTVFAMPEVGRVRHAIPHQSTVLDWYWLLPGRYWQLFLASLTWTARLVPWADWGALACAGLHVFSMTCGR